jgi:tol-pal system beta propeller repeat protein TolB
MRPYSSSYLCLAALSALAGLGCSEAVTEPFVAVTRPAIASGQIVYYELVNYYGIVVANPDGSPVRVLSPSGSLDIDPAVSRDGKRIAFANALPNGNDWNIFVMNADGTNRVQVTNLHWQNQRPAWSPDGKRIAFDSDLDRTYRQIYVVNADGTGLTQLTSSKGNSGSPEWSPDGTRILFDRDLSGWENKGIYLMNADGTNVTPVTSGHFDRQPTWSPDGKLIAFTRQNLDDGGRDLFVVNADGSGTKQITSGIKTAADPAWSPDGKMIAFSVTTSSRICVDTEYGTGETFWCGYDIRRVDLNGVIASDWSIQSAFNAAWYR